jgi:hypothetical protein
MKHLRGNWWQPKDPATMVNAIRKGFTGRDLQMALALLAVTAPVAVAAR